MTTPRTPLDIAADGYDALTAWVAADVLDLPDGDRARRVLGVRGMTEYHYTAGDADAVVDDIARQWIALRRLTRLSTDEAEAEQVADGYAAWLAPFAREDIRRHGAHVRATAGDALADRIAAALRTPAERARDAAVSAGTAHAVAVPSAPVRGDEATRQRHEEEQRRAMEASRRAAADLFGVPAAEPEPSGIEQHKARVRHEQSVMAELAGERA